LRCAEKHLRLAIEQMMIEEYTRATNAVSLVIAARADRSMSRNYGPAAMVTVRVAL
jgi:hypothetical protein